MANIKISQLPAKGANLEATDLLEVSEFNGTGYVTKSITGQEIIDSASGGGGVTDVTATAPIVSTGGTTPDISMAVADAGHDGYLSSTDWNTFNDKQEQLVSGTNIKTINGSSVLGSGNLTISGGLKGINSIIKLSSGDIVSTNISTSASYFNVALVANRLYTIPFIPNEDIVTSNLLIFNNTATASTFAKILIYSDLNGLPDTKIYESSSLDLSTTGQKTATTTQTLTAGTTYWITLHASSTNSINTHSPATLSVIKMTTNSGGISSYYSSAPFGSAPTTFGAVTPSAASFPFIGITKA